MNYITINYHKWNKKDFMIFKKSCSEKLDIKESQIFQPYFSLYFHIYNTKNSHSLFDMNRRFILKNIEHSSLIKYYSSNSFIKGMVYDKKYDHEYDGYRGDTSIEKHKEWEKLSFKEKIKIRLI